MRRPALLALALAGLVTGAPAVASDSGGVHVRLVSEQKVTIADNQGVARAPGGWIFSGTRAPLPRTDTLTRVDDELQPRKTLTGAIPQVLRAQGYNHIGDIDVVGDVIYAPIEQPDFSLGHQVTAMYDLSSLRYKKSVVIPQNENSFVTVDAATMTAYSMQHFDGRYLTRYDVRDGWRRLPPLRMSRVLHHTQGADIDSGFIWISTSDKRNDLYRVNLHTGAVDPLGTHAHPGGEGEGIDATDLPSGRLHALIFSPSDLGVFFEHFAVEPDSSPSEGSGHDFLWFLLLSVGGVLVVLGGALVIRRRRSVDADGSSGTR